MLTYGSLFAGYGGLDLAVEDVTGATCAWYSEIDLNACTVLAAHHPGVPNLGDVTTVDWSQVPPVDVICGGSPCQDLSSAGRRAGMMPGTRSGLWASMCKAVEILRPRYVLWENVSGALSACASSDLESCPRCVGGRGPHRPVLRAAGRVVGDLSALGYDSSWAVVRASDVGACHRRERLFILAVNADGMVRQASESIGGRPGAVDELGPVKRTVGSDRKHRATSDSEHDGFDWPTLTGGIGQGQGRVQQSQGRNPAPADASIKRLRQHAGEPPGQETGTPGGHVVDGADRPQPTGNGGPDFGPYAPAIARWETVIGRPVPHPNPDGRLSPAFVEWMMGLPEGWVTGFGLSRTAELKMLGNGVVPQQATAALAHLLDRTPVPA